MRKLFTLILFSLFLNSSFAQKLSVVDSLDKTFKYQYGVIKIRNGIGTITVPKGFKYLEPVQAEKVLTEIWNNPKSENITLGFILPENQSVLDERGYVFNIQYDEIGYVKDDDANDIDYDELLKTLQKETEEANVERKKEGYGAINFIGWAAKPYYDEKRNILHWAKELKFGTDSINTLNYNVRVLGRKGVLVLNAIAGMNSIALVKADVPKVLNIVNFSDGYKYADFDSKVDDVAAWTIGGLVAGKILAKVGFFALILKFWKVLAIAVVSVFSLVKKKLFGGKDKASDEVLAIEAAEEKPKEEEQEEDPKNKEA